MAFHTVILQDWAYPEIVTPGNTTHKQHHFKAFLTYLKTIYAFEISILENASPVFNIYH